MAIDTAKSTSSTVSQVLAKYYDKLFLERAEAQLVHKQLGQRSTNVGAGQGGVGTGMVQWTRWSNLSTVTAGQGEGVPTTAVSLTATAITATLSQYDNAVTISDILARASFGDITKSAMEILAYNAGISIDTIIRNAVAASLTTQNATGVAAAAWTSIPATGVLSISEIRKAVRTLKRNDTPTQSDGFYVAVVHPDTSYDLMGDTTTGGWIDANKYMNAEKLFNGEIGKMYGTRFLETSNGYVKGTGVTSSASIYTTSVFGKEAFGISELQQLKTFVKGFGTSGAADPTDKISSVGWKCMFGVAVLNSAFGVNINHTVSSTA